MKPHGETSSRAFAPGLASRTCRRPSRYQRPFALGSATRAQFQAVLLTSPKALVVAPKHPLSRLLARRQRLQLIGLSVLASCLSVLGSSGCDSLPSISSPRPSPGGSAYSAFSLSGQLPRQRRYRHLHFRFADQSSIGRVQSCSYTRRDASSCPRPTGANGSRRSTP